MLVTCRKWSFFYHIDTSLKNLLKVTCSGQRGKLWRQFKKTFLEKENTLEQRFRQRNSCYKDFLFASCERLEMLAYFEMKAVRFITVSSDTKTCLSV